MKKPGGLFGNLALTRRAPLIDRIMGDFVADALARVAPNPFDVSWQSVNGAGFDEDFAEAFQPVNYPSLSL